MAGMLVICKGKIMVVELISVGTELLLGNIVNTHAAYLSQKCAAIGLSSYTQTVVGDNEERLKAAISTALNRSNIVILTGGLGPTKDDLTKEVTAKTLGKKLISDSKTKERIASYFVGRDDIKVVTENNWKQAEVIEGAMILDNDNGTAPGFIVKTDNNKHVILMPGPPNEMHPMFETKVIPYLKTLTEGILYSEMVKVCGIGESQAETMILDLIENQTNPTIAPYAKTSEVHFRITASGKTEQEAKELVIPVVEELKKRFGDAVYTTKEEETLEEKVVNMLLERNMTITTAESLTGGLIAGRIVNVSGASAVFDEGFITYSDRAKHKILHVSKETLKQYGVVSEETAYEMAKGALEVTQSDVSIAVTGLAGPDGGTDEKPIGLVYIGCCVDGKVKVEKYNFKGNRQKIRDNTVVRALDLVRRCIL